MLKPCDPLPRAAAAFVVVRQRNVNRPSVDGNKAEREFEWVQTGDPHPTALAAMRAYIEALEPGLIGFPDDLIRRHWPSYKRNHGVKLQLYSPPDV